MIFFFFKPFVTLKPTYCTHTHVHYCGLSTGAADMLQASFSERSPPSVSHSGVMWSGARRTGHCPLQRCVFSIGRLPPYRATTKPQVGRSSFGALYPLVKAPLLYRSSPRYTTSGDRIFAGQKICPPGGI